MTPPKIEAAEVEILDADQIAAALDALSGSRLYPIAVLALASGARRGELLALRWQNVDLERAIIKIEHSLEQTKAGLRFKSPKSKYGRRSGANSGFVLLKKPKSLGFLPYVHQFWA